jgi:uncharacterized protein YjiS (DUF1127 family)
MAKVIEAVAGATSAVLSPENLKILHVRYVRYVQYARTVVALQRLVDAVLLEHASHPHQPSREAARAMLLAQHLLMEIENA